MNFSQKRLFIRGIFLSAALLFLLLLGKDLYSSSGGITGLTKRDGGTGCICHGFHTFSPEVSVFFQGPDSVAVGQTQIYRIYLAHGPAVKGGFDVAAFTGILDTVSFDTGIRVQDGELTHRFPKQFVNDTVFWTFKYTAPLVPVMDTLYAVANSTNFNGEPDTLDLWNFSANFPVRVYIPLAVIPNSGIVKDFTLYQNYPNPFNPSTKIKYELLKKADVNLKIFNVQGVELVTLFYPSQGSGEHEIELNMLPFSSGVYFYRLSVNDFSDVKTMVLLK